ncbi:MAG TPA: hypothetical protein VNV25_19910 [Gemmatimonadaceae bacterium]|jgi:hypothetical protein|nr:hypothetical protein [Gemmatimonadaceae bacterium]
MTAVAVRDALSPTSRSDVMSLRPTAAAACTLSAALIVIACMHTNATMLSTTSRPAIDPSAVTIYTSADKVPAKYDEVALIDSHGDDALTSYHQMIESMRKQAAKVGANGLILSTDSDAGTVAKVAHVLIGTSADRKGKSVAIWVYPVTATTTSAQPATVAAH